MNALMNRATHIFYSLRLLQESRLRFNCFICRRHLEVFGTSRRLSTSCPVLTDISDDHSIPKNGNNRRSSREDDTEDSHSYNAFSDILNLTSKSREDDSRHAIELDKLQTAASSDNSGPDLVTVNFTSGPAKSGIIMGIETSFDDTAVAIVNTEKQILGEALNSQLQIHLNHGGTIPPVAKHLHEQHIRRIIKEAMDEAKMTVHDLDAIATTVKPGLTLSLLVGLKHGTQLCLDGNKPFIPIHHMKAHALTCRMIEDIQFPYLVLLISGGHCLLAIAKSIDNFEILGTTIDDAPGEALDKTARRLKLHNLPEGSSLAGGAAIEFYAKRGNPEAFKFPTPMYKYRDCNWSFSGLKFIALRHILREERAHGCDGSDVIPTYADLCASFQYSVVSHLCKKVQRGIIYADLKRLIPSNNRVLVVSGGVACNEYIRRGLELVGKELNYRIMCLPKKLCTDNGVMIAWNGVEKWKVGSEIVPPSEVHTIEVENKSPIGVSLHEEIRQLNIRCDRIKMRKIFESDSEDDPKKLQGSGTT